MADEHVRELERRWSESESPEDEERYLRAALRAGTVDREALERAAHLGHRPAQSALDIDARESSATLDWKPWAEVVATWGQEACVRVGIALTRAVVPWVDRFDGPDDRLVAATGAVEAWACDPSVANAKAIEPARLLIDAVGEERWNAYGFCDMARSLCSIVSEEFAVGRHFTDTVSRIGYRGVQIVRLKSEVAAEVVPWLLGRADPVARRRANTGRWVGHHTGIVRQLEFLPDGSLMVCTGNGTMDRRRFAPESVVSLPRHRSDIYASAASPDGRTLVTGDVHGGLVSWDLTAGADAEPTLLGDSNRAHDRDSVRSVVFLADGTVLAGCGSGAIEHWDTRRRELMRNYPGARRAAGCIAAAPDASYLLAGGSEGTLARSIDCGSGDERRRWSRDERVSVAGLAILGDGKRAVVAWSDALVELLDVESGAQLRTYGGQARTLYGLAVSENDERLATVGKNGLLLWETSGARLAQWELTGLQFVVVFAPDGALITGARVGGLYRVDAPDILTP